MTKQITAGGIRALAFSIDENYEMPFRVLWFSLLATNSIPDSKRVFFLHNSAMNSNAIHRIQRLVIESGHRPEFIDAEKRLPAALPIKKSDHVSRATFYRLYLASLLPQDVQTVIHLDLDIVALRSARELFEINLEFPIAAVDHATPRESRRIFGDRLGTYFQAGVLLVDLAHWRFRNVESQFEEILDKNQESIMWWDQDVLNMAFANDWQRLPLWLNVSSAIRGIISPAELENSAVLVHYDGSRKPWIRYSPQKYSEFWYASYEKIYGYSLKESLKRKMLMERWKRWLAWPFRAGMAAFRAFLRFVGLKSGQQASAN